MGSNKETMRVMVAKIKRLEHEVEDYKEALRQSSLAMDTVLYEVCKKYGSDKKMWITIDKPDVEKRQKLGVSLIVRPIKLKGKDKYRIIPVSLNETDEK